MLTKEEMLAFVAEHPKITSADLAQTFGLSHSDASGRLARAYKAGVLTRVKSYVNDCGAPVYGYTMGEKPAEKPVESRERKRPAKIDKQDGVDLSSGITALAEGIAKQIVAQVVHALQGQLTRELAGVVPPVIAQQPLKVEAPKIETPVVLDPPVIEAPKPQRAPKVAIIGVTPQQAGILSSEFADTYDLSFWQNDGIPRLRSIGIACELCLVTKFVSHKATEVLTAQGANWRKVTGGIDSIRDALTGYYVERA